MRQQSNLKTIPLKVLLLTNQLLKIGEEHKNLSKGREESVCIFLVTYLIFLGRGWLIHFYLLLVFLFIYFPWKSTGGEWLFNGLAEINVSRGEKTSSLILADNKESTFFSAKTFN